MSGTWRPGPESWSAMLRVGIWFKFNSEIATQGRVHHNRDAFQITGCITTPCCATSGLRLPSGEETKLNGMKHSGMVTTDSGLLWRWGFPVYFSHDEVRIQWKPLWGYVLVNAHSCAYTHARAHTPSLSPTHIPTSRTPHVDRNLDKLEFCEGTYQ